MKSVRVRVREMKSVRVTRFSNVTNYSILWKITCSMGIPSILRHDDAPLIDDRFRLAQGKMAKWRIVAPSLLCNEFELWPVPRRCEGGRSPSFEARNTVQFLSIKWATRPLPWDMSVILLCSHYDTVTGKPKQLILPVQSSCDDTARFVPCRTHVRRNGGDREASCSKKNCVG